jgi:hypothetical protein
MRLKNFIKRKRPLKDKIIDFLFVFSGTQLYLNWILPTNPQSKNPLYRLFYGKLRFKPYAKNYKDRLGLACGFIGIHTIAAIMYIIVGHDFLGWSNVLVNLYPILVNFYIGYQCIRLMNRKKEIITEQTKNAMIRSARNFERNYTSTLHMWKAE